MRAERRLKHGPVSVPEGIEGRSQGLGKRRRQLRHRTRGETVTVQPFFAPGGDLEFFADGTSPVSIEILSKGKVVNSSPPFGPTVVAEVPLVESVPGALDASVEIDQRSGRRRLQEGQEDDLLHHGAEEVPEGRLPVEVRDGIRTFLGGATAEATYKAPCPKK